jgi:hypothetical protein
MRASASWSPTAGPRGTIATTTGPLPARSGRGSRAASSASSAAATSTMRGPAARGTSAPSASHGTTPVRAAGPPGRTSARRRPLRNRAVSACGSAGPAGVAGTGVGAAAVGTATGTPFTALVVTAAPFVSAA